jgi:hypothetical protein
LGGTPGTGSENKAIDDHHQIAFLERIWKEKLLFILKLWDGILSCFRPWPLLEVIQNQGQKYK